MKVFVYGTLRRGCANHSILLSSTFVGAAKTVENFTLGTNNRLIPFVAKIEGPSQITGEVYEVTPSILKRLDFLESHPNLYCRQPTQVIIGHTGRLEVVELYFGNPQWLGPGSKIIESGDYRQYLASLQPAGPND